MQYFGHPLWKTVVNADDNDCLDNVWQSPSVTTEAEFAEMKHEAALQFFPRNSIEFGMWMLFNALLFTNYSGQDSGE